MNLYPEGRKKAIDEQIQNVCNALGVTIERQYLAKGHDFEVTLRLPELPKPYGMAIFVGDDYQTWRLEIRLDNFSRVMLDKMRTTFIKRKDQLEAFHELASRRSNQFTFRINGQDISILTSEDEWQEFKLIVSKSYSSEETEYESLSACLLDFFCLILILVVEETEWEVVEASEESEGQYEGALTRVEVNRYERNRYNRALCLAYYGFACRGCGHLLERIYGPLGANVIHVHHIVPVSKLGSGYRLDPIKDLVPLCPNCHNIVHRLDPPLAIEELRKITKYN